MASVNLYPHQREAIDKMRNGCILCGGVGSGKSRTALAYYYKCNGGNLDDESDVFSTMDDPPQDLYIITTARKRDTHEWDGDMTPFMMSTNKEVNLYSNKIIVDSWNNIGKYIEVRNAFFIFDEQRVVGSGMWVRAFLQIAKKNNWILLSATPGDNWSDYIPIFVANGFFKNRTEFTREHVVYSRFTKFPKIERYINTGRLIRLRDRVLVDMDFNRKTKAHHEDVKVSFDIPAYKNIIRNRWNPWSDKPIGNASELCYALRRIVNSDESRQIALLELFEKHSKVIIFYNFDYELDILRNLYYGDDVEVAEWNGHKHQPVPDSDKWVYLVQYDAGAEGWNCIKTDTIIFWSQTYSYKTLTQSCGRIDRLNTPFTDLYYYHLKSHAGIDNAISRAISDKKDFNEMRFPRRHKIKFDNKSV